MNRELKFRAWNDKDKLMSDPFVLFEKRALMWRSKNEPGAVTYASLFPEYNVMQFIGTHDGNGEDIYESDIISFTINFSDERHSAYWSEPGFEGEVFFDKFGWAIRNVRFPKMLDQEYVFKMQGRDYDKALLERYSKIRSASFSDISSLIVIRNIYEP